MGNDVFANGRELSCKAGSGKSICAFPDVCFTPPQTPATPPGVPIPYPNTGMASDTSKGSRDVKITRKEVMLKNKSMFKKSVGDQAGCAPKKGVVTSQTGGKVYFNSWSMDVKIEGENAVRHLDLTTHNHGSVPGNTPTWPYIDQMAMGGFKDDDPCKEDIIKEQESCAGFKPYGEKDACDIVKYKGDDEDRTLSSMTKEEATGFTDTARTSEKLSAKGTDYKFKGGKGKAPPAASKADADATDAQKCLTARTCQLVPYEPKGDQPGCCRSQTGHHLVEASSFFETGRGDTQEKSENTILEVGTNGAKSYSTKEAPCICAFGPSQWRGSHGQLHTIQGNMNKDSRSAVKEPLPKKKGADATEWTISYGDAKKNGVAAADKVNPNAACNSACMEAQLDAYHVGELEIKDSDKIKCVATGRTKPAARTAAEADIAESVAKKRRRGPALGGS